MSVSVVILSIILSYYVTHSQCDLTCENVDDDIAEIVEQMDDLGYSVMSGNFELYDPETSNVYIPFARPDTDYLVSVFEDGNSYYRFGGQDAIVWRGCTPPTVTYLGYRSYSAARIIKQDNNTVPTEFTILEASLGDTINQLVINTESNDDTSFDPPFDRKTNIVTTGDKQTWTDVMQSYINAGLLEEMSLNLDAIANGPLLKFGGPGWFKYSESELDTPRDTISIVIRIQFDENSGLNGTVCDKASYLNQSFPFRVFYKDEIRPREPIKGSLRQTKDKKQCRRENCYETKYYFDKAVSNIIDYVKKEYNYKFVSNVPLNDDDGQCKWLGDWWPPNKDDFVYIFKHGFYCILYQKDCMFDNRDTYYSWNGQDQILTDDDFYLVVGLNHNNFSLSTVNSISLASVTNPDNGNAFEIIDTVTNQEYEQFDLRDIVKCKKPRSKSKGKGKGKSKGKGRDDRDDRDRRRRRLKGSDGRFKHHKKPPKDNMHQCKELEDVFAVQIGRPDNCLNTTVIPSICPDVDVLAAEERFIFFGEATLNPVTKTMPDQDCLIEWRLLKFSTATTTSTNDYDYNNNNY